MYCQNPLKTTKQILKNVSFRYIAIGHPISYAQYGARGGRAMISITIVWGVSVAVALPLLLGVNPMEENDVSFEAVAIHNKKNPTRKNAFLTHSVYTSILSKNSS